MKASELRIGNYITKSVGTVYRVEGIVLNNVFTESMSFPATEFSGIPLTEEWLIKFGYVKGKTDDFHTEPLFRKQGCEYMFSGESFVIYSSEGYSSPTDIGEVKFVHQFQNLYFYLEGEELNT